MRRSTSRSRRVRGSSSPHYRRRIVVFTEGEKTEVSYISHWARRYRGSVDVVIEKQHGVPWTLVKAAARARRANRRLAGTQSKNTDYWCVFDRNSHLRIPDSLQMARGNGINVALSNPCIELWFILHFRDLTRHIERRVAQRESESHLGWKKKALPTEVLEKLESRFEDAKRRAQILDRMHEGDGREPRSNPSSDIWRLVDRIRGESVGSLCLPRTDGGTGVARSTVGKL